MNEIGGLCDGWAMCGVTKRWQWYSGERRVGESLFDTLLKPFQLVSARVVDQVRLSFNYFVFFIFISGRVGRGWLQDCFESCTLFKEKVNASSQILWASPRDCCRGSSDRLKRLMYCCPCIKIVTLLAFSLLNFSLTPLSRPISIRCVERIMIPSWYPQTPHVSAPPDLISYPLLLPLPIHIFAIVPRSFVLAVSRLQ